MFTAFIWFMLLSVNTWSMIDSLNKGQYKMACLSAYVLGFMTFAILFKVLG